ncbi:choice-of-anchor A family protein [Microbacterium halotolerans]|uniref:choice-of-anchor A family protein n=1 Tax=Microbacterium halotolerans TaxID=246613 RepID=UPI000E6AB73E|nr:choice-of-anchor A family protein [Microbacterium halotolerans]
MISSTRFRAISAAAALALVASGGVVLSAAPASAAAVDRCPAIDEMPDIGNEPTFTDSGVAVYAGGDYTVLDAAAESEGLLVVAGDANIDKTGGVFNVGSVGVGSGIAPAGGDTMLAVGGSLGIADGTRVDVGALVEGGGGVRVGETASGAIETNGAPREEGLGAAAAVAPYADFSTDIADASSRLGELGSNAATTVLGNTITFTGVPGEDLQVFDITAADLSTGAELHFDDIPENAAILVNVVGGQAELSPYWMGFDGTRLDDPSGAGIGGAAARILWNFTDATDVTIGGSSQVLGSLLAPSGSFDITASTNGRVYAGGDITTRGTGNEQHNYPWVGDPLFGCEQPAEEPAVGGFDVVKVVTGDASALVPADTEFTVEYRYDDVVGELTVRADGEPAVGPEDIPEGTLVTVGEVDLPTIDGVEWGEPVIDAETSTIEGDQIIRITVTNTAEENSTSTDTDADSSTDADASTDTDTSADGDASTDSDVSTDTDVSVDADDIDASGATDGEHNGTDATELAVTGAAAPIGIVTVATVLLVLGVVAGSLRTRRA